MAKIIVSGTKAVSYDGKILHPSSNVVTVADTYQNKIKADTDVSAGLVTISQAFTATLPGVTNTTKMATVATSSVTNATDASTAAALANDLKTKLNTLITELRGSGYMQ